MPESPWEAMSPTTMGLIAGMGTLLLGMLAYFFVLDPMRRRKPLKAALKIIERDQRPQFSHAEELLDQSLLAGMRKKDIAQARFALAFLRSILGNYEEAATVLSDLEKSGAAIDRATAYLILWVRSQLKNHERVERIFHEHEKLLIGFEQTELIVSISYLALARLRWARREINGAMHYFDQVRKLKVLADEIPGHIDDHEVVMGTVALFEKNNDEAQKHFEAAVEAASKKNVPSHGGRLGIVLCQWRTGDYDTIDATLEEILTEMQPPEVDAEARTIRTDCPHCGKVYHVLSSSIDVKVQCKGCRRRFVVQVANEDEESETGGETEEATDSEISQDKLLSDDELLLRNTRLWHCMSRIISWLQFEDGSGLPDEEHEMIHARLELVTKIDPDFGDPYLVGGLIRYYFARDDEERNKGHELIGKAVDKDVHVPEVLQLLDRENRLAQLSEYSPIFFHQVSRDYAANPEVDDELRQRFIRNMNRRKRFSELGAIEGPEDGKSVAPSLENLQGRGKILQTRVSNIVRYRLADSEDSVREEIGSQLEELQERSSVLADEARAFQQTEMSLMESTGEFLFSDEEPDDEPSGTAEHDDTTDHDNEN